jgi:hypothetical protein
MDQGVVKNTSNQDVEVMFDGFQVYFKPGQSKVFSSGVATHIANESLSLELVVDEVSPVVEEVAPQVVEEATVLKCKKCNFETESKGELLSHYKTHKK